MEIKNKGSVQELISQITQLQRYVSNMDGQIVSPENRFIPDSSFLHKSEESAKFERDEKEVFDLFQSVSNDINKILE